MPTTAVPAVPATHRAVVLRGFGDASRLEVARVPTPRVARPDEMLVRVRATGVNPIEWKMREGLGPIRFLAPRLLGRPMVLGLDFSGEVVEAGPAAGFAPGVEVFGRVPLGGTYAEHVLVRPADRRTAVARKPARVPHGEAGPLPFAALVAYAGLVSYGGLPVAPARAEGPRVLVSGASGGVGHLALQMARRCLGASLVVGVCSSRNAAFAREMGAHEVVEYDRTPLEEVAARPEWRGSFDLVFDAVGDDRYFTLVAAALLRPGAGRFVTAAPPPSRPGRPGEDLGLREGAALAARLAWRRLAHGYRLIPGLFGGLPTRGGFADIARWVEDGRLAVHVWKTFELDEIREAHAASETGRAVGKIAVVVGGEP
jgi:NADPH:quinone reductase-like Zn-dependent oxidoreductase